MLIENIKRFEGFRAKPYRCPAGKLTIGYGFNLDDNELPEHIAEALLVDQVNRIRERLSAFDWFAALNEARQNAVIDMAYQMGVAGVLKFKNMIAAIGRCDFDSAADEIMQSKYGREYTTRAKHNALIMRTGTC